MTERALRVLTHYPSAGLDEVRARFPQVEFVEVPQEGEPPADLTGDILLTWAWGSPNLAAVAERGVQWVHTIGTGVDRFPLDAIEGRVLTCARGATDVPIAEWAFACMLASAKELPERWLSEPPEVWNMATLGMLSGSTLGLIGLGTIGLALAERALAFDMRVRAVRRSAAPSPLAGVEIAPNLEDLLASADHVVVAAAATKETRHLLDAAALLHVKPGVHLVNVARGTLIDQDALREALDADRVALASLDVCDPEPLPAGHWLYTHPRVRLSAHVSWAGPGSIDAILATFTNNLERYLSGAPLEGVVDLERGY